MQTTQFTVTALQSDWSDMPQLWYKMVSFLLIYSSCLWQCIGDKFIPVRYLYWKLILKSLFFVAITIFWIFLVSCCFVWLKNRKKLAKKRRFSISVLIVTNYRSTRTSIVSYSFTPWCSSEYYINFWIVAMKAESHQCQ